MNRRGFLKGILAAAAAPYVVTKAGVLMPVRPILTPQWAPASMGRIQLLDSAGQVLVTIGFPDEDFAQSREGVVERTGTYAAAKIQREGRSQWLKGLRLSSNSLAVGQTVSMFPLTFE